MGHAKIMRDRIDPLIAERAPWLYADRLWTNIAKFGLDRLLSYDECIELGNHFKDMPVDDIMVEMEEMLARDVEVTGLEHIPRQGPALVVANHPTGIADGIILNSVLRPLRSDAFYYANSDILRVLPQFEGIIAPVEWREDKRSHAKTRETMSYTRKAIDEGRLGVIFPSGRLAKRRGLKLHERPWMASAAMIARKFDLQVIPVNIRSRNSALFYLFDFIHPSLRDITLFYETLNKSRQPFRLSIGAPMSPSALPVKSDEAIEVMRAETLALGGRYAPTVSIVENTRKLRLGRRVGHGY